MAEQPHLAVPHLAVPHLAVVEDEPAQRQLLAGFLARQGFRVSALPTAAALRRLLVQDGPALVLLDVRLPDEDGVDLARALRLGDPRLGIILVTASDETIDRVLGLEAGADDYVTKPFEPRELLARVRSLLRRIGAAPPPAPSGGRTRMGRCILDLDRRLLLDADGAATPLAASEFDLLRLFATNPNRALSREYLLERTSHRDGTTLDRTIDLRVARLRRKIEVVPGHPDAIRTVRGIGYMFVPSG